MRDGVVTTPSAPKLRRVLALLSIHANNVVRTDQLIEELWEDRPPLSATTTLQTYVYQLRKLHQLGSGARMPTYGAESVNASGTPALHTTPNGYTLAMPADGLDAQRFAQLAERGRAELDAGDLESAAKTLRGALQLWRGPALTDVGVGPVLQAAVVWLEELRKSVMEQRLDADLALGRHHELIGELTSVVAQQPTHEGFQAKLMLTLYRCGRRSDALQVYQRAREALADELGLEPSPELQRLQRAVLGADPSLDPPKVQREVVRASAPVASPSQLPPGLPALVGRCAQLDAAQQVLMAAQRSAPPVVVAVGAPGSGKSAFCVHVAHRVRGGYPDGQLFAALTGPDDAPVEPAEVLGDFLRAVGIADSCIPGSAEDRARMFRSWTADRRVLVVLDDVVSTNQLLPLLPTGSGCATLVASRRRLSGPAIGATVSLDPFGDADGLRLLTNVLGRHRVTRDMNAARELVEMCDGLPLALRAAASELELRPHWSISRQVYRMRRYPHQAPDISDNELDMYASVRRTYRLMPAPTQAAFRAMARADQPVSTELAAETLGMDEPSAESLLEDLVQFQLAEVDETGDGDEYGSFRYRLRRSFWEVAQSLECSGESVRSRQGRDARRTPAAAARSPQPAYRLS